jgi:hypothetical protein
MAIRSGGRRWVRPGKAGGRLEHFRRGSAHADISDVYNRVPIAAELADLLLIDFEKKVGAMTSAVCRGLQILNTEASAGNGGEDPHQSALRVAIVDVKCVHWLAPKINLPSPCSTGG